MSEIVTFKSPGFLSKKYGVVLPSDSTSQNQNKKKICLSNYFPKSLYGPSPLPLACTNSGCCLESISSNSTITYGPCKYYDYFEDTDLELIRTIPLGSSRTPTSYIDKRLQPVCPAIQVPQVPQVPQNFKNTKIVLSPSPSGSSPSSYDNLLNDWKSVTTKNGNLPYQTITYYNNINIFLEDNKSSSGKICWVSSSGNAVIVNHPQEVKFKKNDNVKLSIYPYLPNIFFANTESISFRINEVIDQPCKKDSVCQSLCNYNIHQSTPPPPQPGPPPPQPSPPWPGPPPPPPKSGQKQSHKSSIGLGVGLGVGIPLLILVIWLLTRKKKYR